VDHLIIGSEERTTHPNPMKASMGATRARLIPHPEQAVWVTRMFEWRAWEKLSVAGIARRLTDLGAPPPGRGAAWSTGTVYGILRNPKYTGRIVLGRTTDAGATRRRGEKKIVQLPREYWTWAAPENAHEALTDLETWEKAQTVGRERGNSLDPGTYHVGRGNGRLYPYRSKIHCNQCHRRMHGAQSTTRRPGEMLTYYVCPTQMHKPQDKAAWPDHVRASIREDALTAKLSEFFDDYALGHDRAARLAELIPASQAQQDDLDNARAQTLTRKLTQVETALNGIAAELGQLAGKTDKTSQAIRDRLTAQFSQRDDEKTAVEAELAAIEQAAPLPDSDLTLADELPYAPGLLACAPDDLRERLAAAFGMQAVYRQDTRQATIVLTITDTTPGIIDAILADPRVDHDTDSPTTSNDTSADVTQSPIAPETADKGGRVVRLARGCVTWLARGQDHEGDAGHDDRRGQQGAPADVLAEQPPSEQHGDDRVDERVSPGEHAGGVPH